MRKYLATLCGLMICIPAAWSTDRSTSPSRKAPRHGMTKDEVTAYYGRPYHRVTAGQDEQWYYRLKFDEVYGRALVPFQYESDNVRLGIITFGPDGRIKHAEWSHVLLR